MKKLVFVPFLLIMALVVMSQSNKNLNLLGRFQYNQDLSDIWGYVDGQGNEYALVGGQNGVSIVDVTTPNAPVEIYYEAGAFSIWRDLKTWNGFAYVTNETDSGLLIIDLEAVIANRGATPISGFSKYYTGVNWTFSSAHNLFIDHRGYCYIFGADYLNGGVLIYDLNNDPWTPSEIAVIDNFYVHDGMVHPTTNRLHVSAINAGFQGVFDVSNPANPTLLATYNTPGVFSHNCWSDSSDQIVFTTDEIQSGYIGAYDISDLTNIKELDRIRVNSDARPIPHNTHYLNDYLITSYYSEGVIIHDVSNPAFMVEVGRYDTSPLYTDGFNGAWGVYPWLPSGNIIAADIQTGLFILGPNYRRASHIRGLVVDKLTQQPIPNALVALISPNGIEQNTTNGAGQYGIASNDSGTYLFEVSAPGYQVLLENVTLTPNQNVLKTFELVNYPVQVQRPTVGQVSIYPNPNTGRIFQLNNVPENATVRVFDLTGKAVHPITRISNELHLPNSLSSGIYTLQIDHQSFKICIQP